MSPTGLAWFGEPTRAVDGGEDVVGFRAAETGDIEAVGHHLSEPFAFDVATLVADDALAEFDAALGGHAPPPVASTGPATARCPTASTSSERGYSSQTPTRSVTSSLPTTSTPTCSPTPTILIRATIRPTTRTI